MKHETRLFLAGLTFLAVSGGSTPAHAQPPAVDLPVNVTTSYKGEEFLLIGNAVRGAGEPVMSTADGS